MRDQAPEQADRDLSRRAAFGQRRLAQGDDRAQRRPFFNCSAIEPIARMVTDLAAKVPPVRAKVEPPAGSRPAPDLSVVICTLGRAGVAETVASVAESAAAAGRDVEIIVPWQGVDTPPDFRGVATVIEVFPAGLAYARNRGAEQARAPIVAFVDDDEVVDGGWVGAVLTAFEQVETAGVFGPVAPRDDRGLPYCRYDGDGDFRVVRGPRALPWTVGTGGNMAFRRADLLAVGGFDVLFGLGAVALSAEDTELIFRLLQSGRPLAWSPDVVVYHPSKTAAERLASRYPYAFGIGKLARRHGDPALAARYAKSIVETVGQAVRARDGRRLRETRETLRGFVAGVGFRARPSSSTAALARAPEAVHEAIGAEQVDALEPLYRPDPHFMYRVGASRLLHLYVNPMPRLREGLALRERFRTETAVGGIPRVHVSTAGADALWVLEDRLPGEEPRTEGVARWYATAARWALEFAGPAGRPVREGAWWADEAAAAVAVSQPDLREAVASALELLGALPGRRLHGDFQRKNLLLEAGGRLGVVDWERAYEDGPPGLDLLFAAVMATGDWPDAEVVLTIADGRDPPWASLQQHLRAAGLDGVDLRPYVLGATAVWAADERERLLRPGLPRPGRDRYHDLLLAVGPSLA